MKVKELIEALKNFDPELPVMVYGETALSRLTEVKYVEFCYVEHNEFTGFYEVPLRDRKDTDVDVITIGVKGN